MLTHFYDIESLNNVFTLCNYHPEDETIDVFYLVDGDLYAETLKDGFPEAMLARILEKNPNFHGTITTFDLTGELENRVLMRDFGCSDAFLVNDRASTSSFPDEMRPVCDTDPEYDEDKHPYLFGYNSYNYDTTMLAYYFDQVMYPQPIDLGNGMFGEERRFTKVTAKEMRAFNDELFTDRFIKSMPSRLTVQYAGGGWSNPDYQQPAWRIRKSMLMSGRHVDVARLNEKQSRVGLKRLLGMLGYQILESDKLKPGQDRLETVDELYDLVAYNVSDVVNLRKLFEHPFYQGQFDLKRGLLKTYPELVYDRVKGGYTPDCRPEAVRRDRLTVDSSSAQFATKSLCPYDHLSDIPAVSFDYPSEKKSKELGIPRVNVLEEARKFFYENFKQPELRRRFDKVYNYYKAIEGNNFNASDNYAKDHADGTYLDPIRLTDIPKDDNCLFYYDADGQPTSCFVTFSYGGIHGAEANIALFDSDMAAWQQTVDDLAYVKSLYPDPLDLRHEKKVVMEDGEERKWSDFIVSGATIKKMEATHADKRAGLFYKNPEAKRPKLFKKNDDGSTKLHPKYTFTSADLTNHEDFTSYYPNMLIMMSAFWNDGLGYDRYAEIFDNKQRFGKLMKDKSLPEEQRSFYAVQREGTKLILNSASGAGDTEWNSPIQMNNRIISMRIIGQLFTWRIGQAQTLYGARIPSTNTDGLYSVLEEELNNRTLAQEAASIGVEIEPEPTYLVSKDSNNRFEMDPDTGRIQSASGGSLACRQDTNPTKSLAHPAITDWALTEYLIVAAPEYDSKDVLRAKYGDFGLDKPFNRELGRSILDHALAAFEEDPKVTEDARVHWLKMFGNVIASSPGSFNYIFAYTDANPSMPIIMQHYNRVYIMKDGTPDTVHLKAANARTIPPATKRKRERMNERPVDHDPMATAILNANGVTATDTPVGTENVIKKVTNIEPEWCMRIENRGLFYLSDEDMAELMDGIDMERYVDMLGHAFEENWMNVIPGITTDKQAETIDQDTDCMVS